MTQLRWIRLVTGSLIPLHVKVRGKSVKEVAVGNALSRGGHTHTVFSLAPARGPPVLQTVVAGGRSGAGVGDGQDQCYKLGLKIQDLQARLWRIWGLS